MKTTVLHRLLMLTAVVAISTLSLFAGQITKGKVTISYDELSDGGIIVINVWNNADKKIELKLDGDIITINANSSAQPKRTAYNYVRYDFATSGGAVLWRSTPKKKPVEDVVPMEPTEATEESETPSPKVDRHAAKATDQRRTVPTVKESVGYAEMIYQDDFFGTEAVNAFTQKIEEYCKGLELSRNKPQYIIDNDIRQFLENTGKEIAEKRSVLSETVQEIARQSNVDASQSSTMNLIAETLSGRIKTREDAINKLNDAVSAAEHANEIIPHDLSDNIANYSIVGAIIILLIILTVVTIRKKKNKRNQSGGKASESVASQYSSSDNPAIVVRRRTTSILKKQCIDDVKGNPAYLMLNTSDFTSDSAVRNIYIKNSCIKDVYNLYAEDLRNSDNPKEDGCMVLGRWVYDDADHTYDISLEDVVFPGDDAVFKEYELNFGGKIKLRIAEKLRKLRRDTNLQYDLVCWIHSHPGLGVFFSNSDDNVQMQLKHPQHPNFLIAFVVDILTSDQEMGIFTFRKDGSMNSKGDITKMHSLEEMYKWALQSERSSFSHDSYFNILDNAKLKMPSCKGVELNNSAIIDLTQIVIEPETGVAGWAVGTTVGNKSGQEFAVSGIVRNSERPGTGIIGCLICMTHMSIPTIQRLISHDSVNLSFVMVYSSKQALLTTIPVVNGELLSDEQFYGDVNIDDLKIWTRRKR